jgi:hypothetical protein
MLSSICSGNSLHQLEQHLLVRGHRFRLVTRERDAYTGHAQRDRLHGGGNRSRVEHILTHVRAVIDTGKHEVWPVRH